MDTEHVKGVIKDIKGKAKEAFGQLSGDPKLELEGKLDQVEGTAHSAAGDVKDSIQR